MSNFADKLSGFFGLSNKTKPEIEWVDIPAGTFIMGSPINEIDRAENETQHEVTISAFKMSKFAITFKQYDKYCEITKKVKPDDENWGRGRQPVINVSWEDAKSFAEWLGCRLPTEAEWEYACRAGTVTPFNTGNNINSSQANYDGQYPYIKNTIDICRRRVIEVGTLKPNAWGLFDMHGNVFEWCNDWYDIYPTENKVDPQGPKEGKGHVQRGGCYASSGQYCRSAYRTSSAGWDYTDGFRIVTSI